MTITATSPTCPRAREPARRRGIDRQRHDHAERGSAGRRRASDGRELEHGVCNGGAIARHDCPGCDDGIVHRHRRRSGTASITASATGYTGSSVNVGVTTNVISVGFVAMAPGQTQGFTVTLAQPAPAGGVTVT